jgi:hypothetical protein
LRPFDEREVAIEHEQVLLGYLGVGSHKTIAGVRQAEIAEDLARWVRASARSSECAPPILAALNNTQASSCIVTNSGRDLRHLARIRRLSALQNVSTSGYSDERASMDYDR